MKKLSFLFFIPMLFIHNLSTCWGKVFYDYDEGYFYVASSTPILSPFERVLMFVAIVPPQGVQQTPLERVDQNHPLVPRGAFNPIEEEIEERPPIFARFLESQEPSVMFVKKFLAGFIVVLIFTCYFGPILS